MHIVTDGLYIAEYLVLRCVCFFVGLLPLRVSQCFSWILGTIGYYLLPHKRKIALNNLRIAFSDEKSEKEIRHIARASLRNLILIYFEFIYFAKRKHKLDKYFYFDKEDRAKADGLTKEKKAAIYVTGHFGNWEFLTICAGYIGNVMHIIGRPIKNKYLYRFVERLRCSTDSYSIDKNNAIKGAIEVFKKKEIIATVIDQRVQAGIKVNFFDKPVMTTTFPALMRIKYDCIMYPTFAIREKLGLFHVIVMDEIKVPEHLDTNDDKIRCMVEQYTKAMEEMVRAYPEQWLWYHRRWRL